MRGTYDGFVDEQHNMSKEYKIIVKEVFKFRDGTSEERTIVERITSKQKTLEEILDDINEEASFANREPWE